MKKSLILLMGIMSSLAMNGMSPTGSSAQEQRQRALHMAAISFPSALPRETLKSILQQAKKQQNPKMALEAFQEMFLDAAEEHIACKVQNLCCEQYEVACTVSYLMKDNTTWLFPSHPPYTLFELATHPLVVQYHSLAEQLRKSQRVTRG